MRTKEEIATILAAHKYRQMLNNATWSQFATALQASSPTVKDEILNFLKNEKYMEAGRRIAGVMKEEAKIRAKVWADTKLADDTLTLAELDEIL